MIQLSFWVNLISVIYSLSAMQGRGNKSSGDNFLAAPNIDHSQDFVRKDLKEWLCWMRFVFQILIFKTLQRPQNVVR